MKKGSVLLLLLLFLSPIVLAQQAQVDDALNNAQDVKDKVEEVRGLSWDEYKSNLTDADFFLTDFLLRNQYIAAADARMQKLDSLFSVFMARDYSFSVTMLFVFLLWLFTLMSVYSYISFFASNPESILASGPAKFVMALAVVVVMAHINIFNAVAVALINLVTKPSSPVWSLVAFIAIILGIVFYLVINRVMAGRLTKWKEKAEKGEVTMRLKTLEERNKGIDAAR